MNDTSDTIVNNRTEVPKGERAKALGAFYTPDKAVNFMIRWAVRKPDSLVIDPSFGNGIFLEASKERVANPSEQVYGIEFDKTVFDANKGRLEKQYSISRLWHGDFFASDSFFESNFDRSSPIEAFEAVVGNPPFIRYQRFKGEERTRALQRALDHGIELPGHASSWAPFLIHAVSLIKRNGRLAMVTPAELGHAAYAKNVLAYLLDNFANLAVLTFQKRLFPKLGEDTYIVLGEGKGTSVKDFHLIDVKDENALEAFAEDGTLDAIGEVTTLNDQNIRHLHSRKTKLPEYLLHSNIRKLYYQKLSEGPHVKRLGDVARVGIGYVTGNNDFFHLSDEDIQAFDIPLQYRALSVRRSSNLPGICLTRQDLRNEREQKKWLLEISINEAFDTLPEGVQRYLEQGKERGVCKGYKIRSRSPWYSVPHVKRSDAFLTYMSNSGPRLVHNTLHAPASNTLHVVELLKTIYDSIDIKLLTVAWYTSLTFLSAELEGHSLGGGMLKIEPSEAKRVVVALPFNIKPSQLETAYLKIDQCLRQGKFEAALNVGDKLILIEGLNYSKSDCVILRNGYHFLRDRRRMR